MKNKVILFSLSLVIIALVGFYLSDPYGSKTTQSDNKQAVENPSPYYSPLGTVVWADSMDGANDTSALKLRGYKPYYRGTGPQGATATWFQGNSSVFNAYQGPSTGYVAANYNVVTGANNIDSWLVFPRLTGGGVQAGDSLYFYSKAPTGSTYPDSIRVMYSTNDSIPEGTWTELGRFKVTTAATWEQRGFRAPTSSANGRFAIRYCVANGGPSGANSDYIGVDYLRIIRTGSTPPPMVNPTNMCAYTQATLSGIWAHASDVLGDTLYVMGGSTAGAGSTTVLRYNIHSNTMGTNGVPIPESKAYHSLTAVGNSLYLLGGGASNAGGTTCYKYTPSTGAWTTLAPAPASLSGFRAMNWGDSVIFCVSGGWSTYSTAVYAYRIASNTWVTSTSLPAGTGRRSFAGGIDGNKLFVSCGYSGTFRNDLVIGTIGADATTITWATGPVVPFLGGKTGSSRPGGVAVNGKFYMITGEVTPAPTVQDTIYVYTVATNTWSFIGGGRGSQAASNLWSAVSYKVMANGNIKIFIPGGALSTNLGQLCCLQVPACTITGIENNTEVPKTYSLMQNYPNPFNPVTKISFNIPKLGFVSLKVYDVLGKEVSTLVSEVKNPGSYVVDFNGASLSSGIYFYRLEADGFTSVKKMMLVK